VKTEPISGLNERPSQTIPAQKDPGNHRDEENPDDLIYSNCLLSIQTFKFFSLMENNLSATGWGKHSPAPAI
jgi:hypothetical protein